MSPTRKSRRPTDYQAYYMAACVAGLALGYYMLDHVATWEEPPLGNTFHIVAGCVLMAGSALLLIKLVRQRYFPKKKKKRDRPIFLDDLQQQKKDDTPKVP